MQTVGDHPTAWFWLCSSKHCCKKKKKGSRVLKKIHLFSFKKFRVKKKKFRVIESKK